MLFLVVFFTYNLLWWLLGIRAPASALEKAGETGKDSFQTGQVAVGITLALVFYCWVEQTSSCWWSRESLGETINRIFVDWMTNLFLSRKFMMKDILPNTILEVLCGRTWNIKPVWKMRGKSTLCSDGLVPASVSTPDNTWHCHLSLPKRVAWHCLGCLEHSLL